MLRAFVSVIALVFLATQVLAQDLKPLTGTALVIGQSQYDHLPTLSNPEADADALADALDDLGFETTRLRDLNARKLTRALDNFTEDAAGADVAVVYFSGHGIEAGGDNWLVPIDADVTTLDEAGSRMVSLSGLVNTLSATVPLTILFLDACRSNPFPPGSMLKRMDGSAVSVAAAGLGAARGATEAAARPIASNLGTVIGFATEPGQVALDGPPGGNSPYAAALVRHLSAMDGVEFGIVMRMVTEEVYLKTQGTQRPWVNETLTRLIYMGAQPPVPDSEAGAILNERRQLLLTMTALSTPQRQQVEATSRMAGVPMDALYGLLKSLGAEIPSEPAELGKILDAQAARVKDLLAAAHTLDSADPEIMRLATLADEALNDGALDSYLEIWQQAKARYQEISKTLDTAETQLRSRRLEGGQVLANTAAAYELKADYASAAANYRQAFEEVARWDSAKAWEYKRREADAWLSQGDEKGDINALAKSISTFDEALSLVPRETSPLEWAWTENNLGNALLVRGRSESGTTSIEQAINAYRAALEVRTNKELPELWAKTQNNLAIAYTELSERNGDPALVTNAIAAYRAALVATSRNEEPLIWATISSNLGNALERQGGAALEEAVQLHRAALEERPRARMPVQWAASQQNLGNALHLLGKQRGDADLIKQGIASYRLALEAVQRENLPLVWSGLHYNIGNALGSLSDLEQTTENLQASVDAYRQALKEERFDRTPASWAKTQYMLGKYLWQLGEHQPDLTMQQQAIAAFKESLRFYTRDRNAADWAITLYETGTRLHRLGGLTHDPDQLSEAVTILRQSLTFYTKERDASDWAETASSYAGALADSGFITGKQQDLDEAISTYRSIMEVQSREAMPLKWASNQVKLASALYFLAVLKDHDAPAREGRAAAAVAAEVFNAQNELQKAQAATVLLAEFDKLINQLPP
jgi:uncharacterized caspase-like protein